jgi:PmbA protein
MPDNILLDRAAQAVDLAKAAGANDVWAAASRVRSISFEVRNGKLEKVQEDTSRSLSLRLFVDGRFSTHGTTDLRPERLGDFIKEAVALTRALQPDPHRALADAKLYEGRSKEPLDLLDAGLSKLTRDERIAWCHEMNERCTGKEQVISSTSSVRDSHVIAAAVSSNGFSGTRETTSIGMSTGVTLQDEGDSRPESGMYASARHIGDLPERVEIGDVALARARARLGTRKGPSLKTTMVVENMAAGRLIGRLLRPARGRPVQRGRSFWKGNLGKKMVSSKLTIIDDPLIPRGLGSRLFDGEGIAARRLPIIEKGVFRNLYLDTYHGRKLEMPPTTGSSSNRIVRLGKRDRDAIVRSIKKGVYVTAWMGGNADPTTGDFSFGIRGHLIEKGRIGEPVGEMNVTGNLLELFENLIEVGSDPWLYSSLLAPTLVFRNAEFSGA